MLPGVTDTTVILKAASEVLGEPLSEPVELSRGRSTVVRCRSSRGGTLVVKSYAAAEDFAAEASGLELASRGPGLLAVDADRALIVMTDLGNAPSLADLLLGDDADAARAGLFQWARGLGELARSAHGRRAELNALRRTYGLDPSSVQEVTFPLRHVRKLGERLAGVGITPPAGLDDDIDELAKLENDGYPGFSPGDTCPDNNLLTPSGLQLLDFEDSGYPSVFLTAVYCRMPFPSCWCSFRLEPTLAGAVEEVFRAELLPVYPDLEDDRLWHAGVRRAVGAWTASTMLLFPEALAGDRKLNGRGGPSPTVRQLMVHRCTELRRELTPVGELPALTETAALLLERAAKEWRTPPLPPFPAFA